MPITGAGWKAGGENVVNGKVTKEQIPDEGLVIRNPSEEAEAERQEAVTGAEQDRLEKNRKAEAEHEQEDHSKSEGTPV